MRYDRLYTIGGKKHLAKTSFRFACIGRYMTFSSLAPDLGGFTVLGCYNGILVSNDSKWAWHETYGTGKKRASEPPDIAACHTCNFARVSLPEKVNNMPELSVQAYASPQM